MSPEIEIYKGMALIKDDKYFTKWCKEANSLSHHLGFLHYLRPFLGGTMVDMGANIGTHSIYYAQFGHVHCFEPNAIAFEWEHGVIYWHVSASLESSKIMVLELHLDKNYDLQLEHSNEYDTINHVIETLVKQITQIKGL